MTVDGVVDQFAATAREFLRVALEVLTEQRVVPPPRDRPYLRIGQD
jgi:hypothetical protein